MYHLSHQQAQELIIDAADLCGYEGLGSILAESFFSKCEFSEVEASQEELDKIKTKVQNEIIFFVADLKQKINQHFEEVSVKRKLPDSLKPNKNSKTKTGTTKPEFDLGKIKTGIEKAKKQDKYYNVSSGRMAKTVPKTCKKLTDELCCSSKDEEKLRLFLLQHSIIKPRLEETAKKNRRLPSRPKKKNVKTPSVDQGKVLLNKDLPIEIKKLLEKEGAKVKLATEKEMLDDVALSALLLNIKKARKQNKYWNVSTNRAIIKNRSNENKYAFFDEEGIAGRKDGCEKLEDALKLLNLEEDTESEQDEVEVEDEVEVDAVVEDEVEDEVEVEDEEVEEVEDEVEVEDEEVEEVEDEVEVEDEEVEEVEDEVEDEVEVEDEEVEEVEVEDEEVEEVEDEVEDEVEVEEVEDEVEVEEVEDEVEVEEVEDEVEVEDEEEEMVDLMDSQTTQVMSLEEDLPSLLACTLEGIIIEK